MGLYSFPGGRVEFGESLSDALHREVREETSLTIEVLSLAGFREAIWPAGGVPDAHFVILCFAARWRAGEPVLNPEHDAFEWAEPEALARLPTTPGLPDLARIALAQGG